MLSIYAGNPCWQNRHNIKGRFTRMSKAKFSKLLFAMMLVLFLALAACNSGSDDGGGDSGDNDSSEGNDDSEETEGEDELYSIEDFDSAKTNEGEAMDGGHLNFGLVSDTVFEGTLNYNFYSGAPDAEIIAWFDESLLAVDENYSYTQDGAAEWEVNDDGNVFTFTIRDNVNWHDGELLQLKTGHLQLKYLLIQTMMVFVMEM